MAAKWIVVFLVSPFIGLLTLATVVKFLEVRRTNAWILTRGRVVRSQAVQREVGKLVGRAMRPEIRNFASVTYEFDAGGRKVTGTRVGIGEDLGNFGVEETLARYPVGKRVEVYYDPANPAQAVLERMLPTDSFRVMGLLIAALTLIGVIVAIGMDTLAAGLRTLLPNPAVTPFVITFTIFALVLLLMAVLARQESKKVASWPETEGTILSSSFDTFLTRTGIDRFAMRILVHRPHVIYAFDVGGTRYQGERISLGVSNYASLKFLVGRDVRRYKSGDKVVVYYDPENPAQAVLNRTDVRPRVCFAFSALFALGAIWASSAA